MTKSLSKPTKTDDRKNRQVHQFINCFVCQIREPVPTAEDHHRTPRAFGGTDDANNRVWLCSSCHTRLHRIQGLLVKGSTAQAAALLNNLFPTNGKARGTLWTLANEAMVAEHEAKESFLAHQDRKSVSISVDVETWEILKKYAKSRKTSVSSLVGDILKREAQRL